MEEWKLGNETDDANLVIDQKLRQYFDGRIVRKDLTKSIKEGANVPVYVLEFLLGQYCSSDDDEVIEKGVQNVKRILSDNFVRPDESQKVLSMLRERGSFTVIDRLTVKLNIKYDRYEADFSNLGIKNIPIAAEYVSQYDRLLCGGIWCIVQLDYEFCEEDKHNSPIQIRKVTPIQMPHIDLAEIKQGRKHFTKDEWITILLRSTGMEADKFTEREKWLLLARMLPLVENNFNLCELGPRSTGKSHLFKEISPNSILVSGGQTTVANLFYNMGTKTVGLVGLWDCVAFDEVAGITFKDKDGVQIMKDYMASGSFARGKEEKAASASMAFVGNINQSVDVLLKTSHLLSRSPTLWPTTLRFWIVCTAMCPVGRSPNIVLISLPTTMALSLTIWQSLCGRCGRSPGATPATDISASAVILIRETRLPSAKWFPGSQNCSIPMVSSPVPIWRRS